jgi:hypothetical protein
MNKLILIVLLITFQYSIAQRRYVPGFIYFQNKDSVEGKIKDNLAFSQKKIKFIDKIGVVKKYSTKQITGYSKLGISKYLSIPTQTLFDGFRFMEVLEDGDLTLLKYMKTYSSGPNYGVNSYGGGHVSSYGGGNQMRGSNTAIYLYIKKNGAALKIDRVPHIGFKNLMLEYISDDLEVKKLVEEKSLTYSDVNLIIRKYNDNKRKSRINP